MSAKLQAQAPWEGRIIAFFTRQYREITPQFPASLNLSGKIAIVTGSNAGLGFEPAKHLLSLGISHLILAVRSQSRGDFAASQLKKLFPSAKIDVWILEMESYKSVVEFSERCKTLRRVDIAILNAGLVMKSFRIVDGTKHETTLQVNYLSTALLAVLLLPVLKASDDTPEPGRLTFVGSDTAYQLPHKISNPASSQLMKDVDTPEGYDPIDQYEHSKFFLIIFAAKLADMISAESIIVNVAMPGLCKGTDFLQKQDGRIIRMIISMLGKKSSSGARAIVNAAVVHGKNSHGSIISGGLIKPYPRIMYDDLGDRMRTHLWEETTKELAFAGVKNVLDSMR